MTSPLVISSTGAPSELHGLHGGRGVDKWKRFVNRSDAPRRLGLL